jgi:hypothetical protein
MLWNEDDNDKYQSLYLKQDKHKQAANTVRLEP